jgi:hypothetical protein
MKFQQFLEKKGQVNESRVVKINESYSYSNGEALNEADTSGSSLLDFFKSLAAYAKISSEWPKLYQEQKDAELDKAKQMAELEIKIGDMKAELDEQKDELIKKQLANVPREQRATKRVQIEQKTTLQINAKKDKLDKAKDAQALKLDDVVNAIKGDITKAESDNQITSDLLKSMWNKSKLEQQRDMDIKFDNDKIDLLTQQAEELNDDAWPKKEAKQRQRNEEKAKEQEEKIKELEQETKDREAEFEKKKLASDDPATIDNMKVVQQGIGKYITQAKQTAADMQALADAQKNEAYSYFSKGALNFLLEEDVPNAEIENLKTKVADGKAEIKKIRKEVNDAKNKLSTSKIKKALGSDETDALNIYNSFSEQWKEVQDQWRELRDDAEKLDLSTINKEETPEGGEKKPEETEKSEYEKAKESDPELQDVPEGEDESTPHPSKEGEKKWTGIVTKKDKDGNDKKLGKKIPESRQFKSNSRIVPTFESFNHSRGLK